MKENIKIKNPTLLTLRAAEARRHDVGRGIARMDPKDMGKIDASVGDIIQLEGKKETVAKLMPAYMEDRGKNIIQIDGIVRENGQIGLDEKVKIKKVDYLSAEKIILSPMTNSSLRGDRDTKYIGRLLEGLPLVSGDRVRANLFGTRSSDFKVISTVPKDSAVLIQPNTKIVMKDEELSEKKTRAENLI